MEHCQVCGKEYETVYSIPDEVWRKITPKDGEAGLLCIECADQRARRMGRELYWIAQEEIDVLNHDFKRSVSSDEVVGKVRRIQMLPFTV